MSIQKYNLSSLYISPLESCNLACKICYTCKTKKQLTVKQVLDFITRFREKHNLEIVTFCGGEVFLLNWFVECINKLTASNLVVEIITNGTIDNLDQISEPNKVNLIVSLDGLELSHDLNRGKGNFNLSLEFLKKATKLDFHIEIFSVVSTNNFDEIDKFEDWLRNALGYLPEITYHPRKPLTYLNNHPISNRVGESEVFGFLSDQQIKFLSEKKKVFPPKNFGCHQLSLMSDGMVYGCCEGINPVGKISDEIDYLTNQYKLRVDRYYKCVEPDFMCGLRDTCKENDE